MLGGLRGVPLAAGHVEGTSPNARETAPFFQTKEGPLGVSVPSTKVVWLEHIRNTPRDLDLKACFEPGLNTVDDVTQKSTSVSLP